MASALTISPASSTAALPISGLATLQAAFAIFRSGGEFYVISLQQIHDYLAGNLSEIEFFRKQNADILLKRYLENQAIVDEVRVVINQFWIDPNTLVFDATAFSPLLQPPTTINFWVAPTAKPCAGNCDVLKAFLLNIICTGSYSTYSYLLRYLAHMLQRPEEKSGIIIVLLGGQGTGKGTFFRILQAIWSRTTIQISDIQEVIGKFNAVLERNFIVCMDEAFFSGDRRALDRLKSLVTEPTCRIEQKYQPARTIDSYHRFFAASNHDHFAHVEQDDRRFVFLRVSDDAKGNHPFFNQLNNTISDPNIIGALVDELLQLDISQFNVRQKPRSTEQILQKLRSLEGFSRFWFEVLTSGDLMGRSDFNSTWIDPIFIPTATLMSNYTGFDKRAEWYRKVQQDVLGREFKRLCPSAKHGRHQQKHQPQRWGWWLPNLPTARREFEVFIGGPVNWHETTESAPGFDASTLDTYWSGKEPEKPIENTVFEILANWDTEDD
jgi:hypothetical protein